MFSIPLIELAVENRPPRAAKAAASALCSHSEMRQAVLAISRGLILDPLACPSPNRCGTFKDPETFAARCERKLAQARWGVRRELRAGIFMAACR